MLFQLMIHFSAPPFSKTLWISCLHLLSLIPFFPFSCASASRLFSPPCHLKGLIKGIANLKETKTHFFEGIQQNHEMCYIFTNKGRKRKSFSAYDLQRTSFLFKLLENKDVIVISLLWQKLLKWQKGLIKLLVLKVIFLWTVRIISSALCWHTFKYTCIINNTSRTAVLEF